MIAQKHPSASAMEEVLVKRNERLVHSVAKGFGWAGLTQEDLFTEGVCGLLTAARRFDSSRGTKFSTMAVHWIRHDIGRAVEASGTVRVPVYQHENISKLNKAREALGREASPEELAGYLGWKMARLKNTLDAERALRVVELDAPVRGGASSRGEDCDALMEFQCSKVCGPEEVVLARLEGQRVREAIASLPERYQSVILARAEDKTLVQIGLDLGMSRERARQIEGQALKQVREILSARGVAL